MYRVGKSHLSFILLIALCNYAKRTAHAHPFSNIGKRGVPVVMSAQSTGTPADSSGKTGWRLFIPSVEQGIQCRHSVLSFPAQCLFFTIVSTDAFLAILQDYNTIRATVNKVTASDRIKEVASELVSVVAWKMSPREIFAIGAGLRAFQLCTGLQFSFDPSVGVAALINLGAIFLKWRWLSQLVVGWTITPAVWKFCGARSPGTRSNTSCPQDSSNVMTT